MKSEETKNLQLLIIVLVIFGIFYLIFNLFIKDKDSNNDVIDTSVTSVVTDYNRFYTVSSCVSKYISYLTAKNTENLLILLSSEYQKENNINSQNIYNYTGIIDGNKNFSPIKMFEKEITDSLYKYYVYGCLQEEGLGGISSKEDFYLVVILDENNMTFAVELYDGSIFK